MKKQAIATTREQSARLLQCGVSADTADMMWSRLDESRDHNLYAVPWFTPRLPNRKITDNDFPAWSLSALLGLFPHIIKDEPFCYYFSLAQDNDTLGIVLSPEGAIDKNYCVSYKETCDVGDYLIEEYSPCPIEACVKAIECLTSYGYKLNEQ